MYRCNECQNFIDNDYHPCEEDTRPDFVGQHLLLCPACAGNVADTKEARDYEISQRHAQWCIEKGITQ